MLEADVSHVFDLPDANGRPRHDGPPHVAKRETWTRLYDELEEDVSWHERERTGRHLREHDRWIPETDSPSPNRLTHQRPWASARGRFTFND